MSSLRSSTLTYLFLGLPAGPVVLGAPVMADQEETFGLQNSPGGSDSREVQSDNKSEKQNGTSSKSPSSQTTYIQQVSISQRAGLTLPAAGCTRAHTSTRHKSTEFCVVPLHFKYPQREKLLSVNLMDNFH